MQQISTLPQKASFDDSSLPVSPPPPLSPTSNKVRVLALAFFIGLATLAAGFFFSLPALMIIGSFSTIASVATAVIGNISVSSKLSFNLTKEAREVIDLINRDTELAEGKILSADFWKGLTKDEDKKAIIKAWLEKRTEIETIPFEELDPTFIVLAYETMRELYPDSWAFKRFCRRFRCNDLIEKMTLSEIYNQDGKAVMQLFAGFQYKPAVKANLKMNKITPFDWELWEKLKDHHFKFIYSILIDLGENPDEAKRGEVTDFVSDLFENIERLNFSEDKKANLIKILYAANFKYSPSKGENPNDGWKETYKQFLEDKARANS